MLLRPTSRPRASADLGYRLLAGVVAGGFVELLGINLARDRNPECPDYLTTSLVAVAVGVAVAIIDPPDDPRGIRGMETPEPGRQGDAWLSPDGLVNRVDYSHAQTAMVITGSENDDYEPTDDELRCCGLDDYDEEGPLPLPWCLAEARLRNEGWQRIKGAYTDLGFELFSEPSTAQRNALRRISAGANLGRKLYIDVNGDACNEDGSVIATFDAPPNSVRERHEAIDRAIACVNGDGPPACREYLLRAPPRQPPTRPTVG